MEAKEAKGDAFWKQPRFAPKKPLQKSGRLNKKQVHLKRDLIQANSESFVC